MTRLDDPGMAAPAAAAGSDEARGMTRLQRRASLLVAMGEYRGA